MPKKGFLLFESSVALSLLAAVILGLGKIQLDTTQKLEEQSRRWHALNAAEHLLELIRYAPPTELYHFPPEVVLLGCRTNPCSATEQAAQNILNWQAQHRKNLKGLRVDLRKYNALGIADPNGSEQRVSIFWMSSERSDLTRSVHYVFEI